MKRAHLIAALAALVVCVVAVAAADQYIRSVETLYVHAVAPNEFPAKRFGLGLQVAAFQQGDLLPIYGSSEITYFNTPYHARLVFQDYPTGFTTFEVAGGGIGALSIAENIAGLGPALAGKKVVISFTPTAYLKRMADRTWYAGNFSPLHANALAFDTDLAFDVKRIAAKRMLKYPKTLEDDPLLRFALRRLADGSTLSRLAYFAVVPLGKLHLLVLHLQDDWSALSYLRKHDELKPAMPREPAPIDWSSLLTKAEQEQMAKANNNPFGFDNRMWRKKFRREAANQAGSLTDQRYLKELKRSQEWTDLGLLLRILKHYGAEPLVVSMPINGTYWGYLGVSDQARQRYYDKLHSVVEPYGVPVVDFSNHDADKYFSIDPSSHTSRKGWVLFDEVLDAYYHGTLHKAGSQAGSPSGLLPGNSGGPGLALR